MDREYIRNWKRNDYKKNPEKYRKKVREYREKNKEKMRQERLLNKEKYASYKLKGRYGITFNDKLEMIYKQNNKCAVCGDVFDGYKNAFVDHNHFTNQVRGILCKRCNFAIGNSRENILILESIIKYLKKWNMAGDNDNG